MTNIVHSVSLIHSGRFGASESNLCKLVEYFGADIRTIDATEDEGPVHEVVQRLVSSSQCVLISARTLADLSPNVRRAIRRHSGATGVLTGILVYGFEPGHGSEDLLKELTSDGLVMVEPSPSATRRINVASDHICRQMAGLSFAAHPEGIQYTFAPGATHDSVTPLISIGQEPMFVRLHDDCNEVFLLAGQSIADLDADITPEKSVIDSFTALAPILMFLHRCLHPRLWHNDSPSACLVIDDPVLKKQYGCLHFEKLLDVMDRTHFCTSIAFIPWNHGRTEDRVARLFRDRRDAYSLCIHGCDHTRGEFGHLDRDELQQKARLALDRMWTHRAISGVNFDDVMVFPQGIFSTAAIAALRSTGYLAAVNSTPFPVDLSHALTLRDLLQVAVTQFSDFPLFTRRYPGRIVELAFDLFLGRPALIVEHHTFFRDGYDTLTETIEQLNQIEPRLQWSNLGAVCSRACRKRVAKDGSIHAEFFTDRFEIRNDTSEPQHYVLIRRRALEGGPKMFINGRRLEVSQDDDTFRASLSLDAGHAADIKIERAQRVPAGAHAAGGLSYRARVLVRRHLSELRDDYFWRLKPLADRTILRRRG